MRIPRRPALSIAIHKHCANRPLRRIKGKGRKCPPTRQVTTLAVLAPTKTKAARPPGGEGASLLGIKEENISDHGTKQQQQGSQTSWLWAAWDSSNKTWSTQLSNIWARVFYRWGSADSDAIADEAEKTAKAVEPLAEREKERKNATVLPDITPFLRTVGLSETRYTRLMASLSTWTYRMPVLQPNTLWRLHRLKLVTTSHLCQIALKAEEDSKTSIEVFGEGDGMAPIPEAVALSRSTISPARLPVLDSAKAALRQIDLDVSTPTRNDMVSVKLAEANALAAAVGGPFTARFVSSSIVPFSLSVARAGSDLALSTISALTAVATAAIRRDKGCPISASAVAQAGAADSTSDACPSQWFVADDPVAQTRYFAIQGSDSIESWKTNLSFDPVVFEDASLGVKVHRGVYNAAKALYEKFLPLVKEHLRDHPGGKIALTGHSLGGSLATCVLMMLKHRGVVPTSALLPVYTFGTAAVFCDGASGNCRGSGRCSGCKTVAEAADMAAARRRCCGGEEGGGILQQLGLPESIVRNVIMARDIVPRAFACDYTLVADLLKRVNASFSELRGLQASDKKLLYSNIGQVLVLQPSSELAWAKLEEPHPMLPTDSALHLLQQPAPAAAAAEAAAADADEHSMDSRRAQGVAPRPDTVREAVLAIMDNPHPLEILADPTAYGNSGMISRHHDPSHYMQALGKIVKRHSLLWHQQQLHGSDLLQQQQQQQQQRGVPRSPAAAAAAAAVLPRRPRRRGERRDAGGVGVRGQRIRGGKAAARGLLLAEGQAALQGRQWRRGMQQHPAGAPRQASGVQTSRR